MDSVNDKKEKRGIVRIVIITVLIAGLLVVGIKKYILPGVANTSDLIDAIPLDASLIIKTKNFNDFISAARKNSIWNEIQKFDVAENLKKQFSYLDSLRETDDFTGNFLNSEAFISFHLVGAKKIKPVFYFPLNRFTSSQIKKSINSLIGSSGKITERKYDDQIIYDAYLMTENKNFSFSFINQAFVLSTSSLLVENSVRQLQSGYSISNIKDYNVVNATAGKNAIANIYINDDHFPNLYKPAFNDTYSGKISRQGKISEWTELDLTLKKNLMLLNGFTAVSDSSNSIENILTGQTPTEPKLHKIFPSNSNSFLCLQLSDAGMFQKRYEAYLLGKNKKRSYDLTLSQYEKKYGVDLKKVFYDILDEEMGIVNCNINSGNNDLETFFVIKTKGENTTKGILLNALKTAVKNEGQKMEEMIEDYTLDEGAVYKIYKFPDKNIFNDLFGVFFNFNEAGYFTFIDNYLVFAGNNKSLGRLIYSNVLNKTLDKSLEYNDFNEYINTRSNLYYYLKIPKSETTIKNVFNKTIERLFLEYHDSFEKINTLALQISGSEEMLYNNITLNYIDEAYENPITEWETLLDTAIDFKPVFVENHYTHEQEIFVQDLNHNIYLINNSGRVIWREKLDETINSEVFQVDYYKNGKLQLLFSTKKAIHLLDRNGNYVERYPVKLRADATTGMSMFDYENNRNYRIFIPCTDRKVYAYDIEGKLVTGWEFDKTDHDVVNPVQYFRIGSKDYIVFADRYKLYILDRKGNIRVKPDMDFIKSINNEVFVEKSGEGKFVLSTNEGKILFIDTRGKVETMEIEKFSDSHYFLLNDMDADGKMDFIFMDGSILKIYNQNKKEIFSLTFKNDIQNKPSYYHFSGTDRKIGIVDNMNGEIYLINGNGSFYKGFPLIGRSMFTIGNLKNNYGNFNLIVGGKNNYLYNYSIN